MWLLCINSLSDKRQVRERTSNISRRKKAKMKLNKTFCIIFIAFLVIFPIAIHRISHSRWCCCGVFTNISCSSTASFAIFPLRCCVKWAMRKWEKYFFARVHTRRENENISENLKSFIIAQQLRGKSVKHFDCDSYVAWLIWENTQFHLKGWKHNQKTTNCFKFPKFSRSSFVRNF